MLLMLEWCFYKANISGKRKHFLANLLGVSQVLPSGRNGRSGNFMSSSSSGERSELNNKMCLGWG